jgi:hypothetical protein
VNVRHIMAQLGITQMKFAIFALQQFRSDYERLPFYRRMKRTHSFVTRELPHILKIMIEEERSHANTPFD